MSSIHFLSRFRQGSWYRLLKYMALAMAPTIACGTVSTTMTWKPSPDSNVTGYNIYYGTKSHDYTNVISVGNVTSATIDNLEPDTTYYFAATAHDANGNQSEFSNEATFAGYNVLAGTSGFRLSVVPPNLENDQLSFSLASGAPANAYLNPTNGMLYWDTSIANANTTGYVTVLITDLTNPSSSTKETILVSISDYLNVASASVPVQTGNGTSLPLTIVSSDSITDLVFNVSWRNELRNPTLSLNPPLSGSLQNQGTNLAVHIWSTTAAIPPGTNQLGQINFRVAIRQSSEFVETPMSGVIANKSNGSAFVNSTGGFGEVVVVGSNPLMRAHFHAGVGRTLTLYSNPGTTYQLQYTTDLSSSANWQQLQTYQPSSVEQTINLNSSNPVVFYRLMQK